jgi:hypothetical protein
MCSPFERPTAVIKPSEVWTVNGMASGAIGRTTGVVQIVPAGIVTMSPGAAALI